MKIILYGLTPFDRSAKVRWLLEELALPYENRWLDTGKKEYESKEYLQINPLGRVPALEIEDLKIFDSAAICAYLADRFIEKGLAPPFQSPARHKYQQWMYFAATTFDSAVPRIMIIEDIPPGELYQAKETALLSELKDAVELLDEVLSNSEYLVENHFSAADICLSYHLYFCRLWAVLKAVIDPYPAVLAYLDRVQKRPAAIKARVFSYEE